MLKIQRYISDELTHFVGKCLSNENDQYDLLINILNSAWLTHPPHEHTDRNSGGLTLSRHLKLSENLMYSPEVICFCDIPLDDIGLHVTKYSRVGLAFSKSFQSAEVIGSKALQRKITDFQHQVFELERFLDFHILSYVKFFDSSLSEDDSGNYYMEREWRKIGNLQFNISDVRRVFCPSNTLEISEKMFRLILGN